MGRRLLGGARVAVGAALWALACGGESRVVEPGSGGVSGLDGSGGRGGSMPAGGNSGAPAVGCPDKAPGALAASCPVGVPEQGCRYALDCQSGPLELTYRCANGIWTVDDQGCAPFDSCEGGDFQVQCRGGAWGPLGAGGDGPAPCPSTRPDLGSDCRFSRFTGSPSCGYRCANGTGWTVASCDGASPSRWLFDGACPDDCSTYDCALRDYVATHQECTTDTDCSVVDSVCSIVGGGCGSEFLLGASGDLAEFTRLDDELTACGLSSSLPWTCASCDVAPATAICLEGVCALPP